MDAVPEGVPISRRQFVKTTLAAATGTAIALNSLNRVIGGTIMKDPFELPTLPYRDDALEPHISAKTLGFHYGKHHSGYVAKANRFVAGTPFAGMAIERIITETADNPRLSPIFNNVAQVYNHTFFWNSMKPDGGGEPAGAVVEKIKEYFGSLDEFKSAFAEAAAGQFGSGWAWLVDEKGILQITTTSNADNPLVFGLKPLLTLDLWEHAYYLDYQNRRPDYIKAFLNNLINWDFVAENMTKT